MNMIVKRFIDQKCIGSTKEGWSVIRCEVEYMDGRTGTLYSVDRHDGKIYGLQESHPPIVTTNEQAQLFDSTLCSDCGKPSLAGLFYVGEQQLCGDCAYKHA